jgi:hypothetical protein
MRSTRPTDPRIRLRSPSSVNQGVVISTDYVPLQCCVATGIDPDDDDGHDDDDYQDQG